jgi:hypothetical protein
MARRPTVLHSDIIQEQKRCGSRAVTMAIAWFLQETMLYSMIRDNLDESNENLCRRTK